MQSQASTVEQYLSELPSSRQEVMRQLRQIMLHHLPDGFEECMSYGMIGYVVPHHIYPAGYHCDPSLPLPFAHIAAQKNHIALYHMGIYGDPDLLQWFTAAYPQHCSNKLDMGKSCIRFRNPKKIPFSLIGQLMQRMSVDDCIAFFQQADN